MLSGRTAILMGVMLGLWAPASIAAAQLAPGAMAPDLHAPALQGGATVRLSDLRGKIVYVDFWASWCAPCRVSMPLLDELRSDYVARGFEVLGVNVDEDAELARKLLRAAAVHYPNVGGVADSMLEQYDLQRMPAGYLLDRRGVVRAVYQGFRVSEIETLRAQVEQLLKEKSP